MPPIVALILADTINTPSSTTIDPDAPSASTSPTTQETQSLAIRNPNREVPVAETFHEQTDDELTDKK
ncbi:hypothetical protein Tco_1287879 [Tanacetum coccineum]